MFLPSLKVKSVARNGSVLVLCAGIAALLAWFFQWRAFLRPTEGAPAFTCDTAACFVLAGLSLLAVSRSSVRLTRFCGFLLITLGALYLTAGLRGTWFSVHALLPEFTARVISPQPLQSCMVSIAVATGFLFLGAFSVLMSGAVITVYSLSVDAILATTVPTIGILGSLFSFTGVADPFGSLTGMSLPTGVILSVAGLAACALLWSSGGDRRGDRHLISTAVTLLLLGVVILLGGVSSAVAAHGGLALKKSLALTSAFGLLLMGGGIFFFRLEVLRRAKLEAQLRDSRQEASDLLRLSLTLSNIALWTWHPATDQTTWTGAVENIFGLEASQLGNAAEFQKIIHPDDRARVANLVSDALRNRSKIDAEFRIVRPDGEVRWIGSLGDVVFGEDGQMLRVAGVNLDIHEQKVAKERLETEALERTLALQKLELKEGELLRLLAEKNTLFHEMHHRVKNNLQVVSSLLRMQANALEDPAAAAALKESHQRVLSMALIHEQLYSNQENAQIDFEDFTQKLVNELFHSYLGGTHRVSCRMNTAQVFLEIDNAIPLGLILNELITNALKYAYPNEMSGEVAVNLHESENCRVTLQVSDNGVGLPEGFNWTGSTSMGLPIVDMLTHQLGGRLTVRTRPGAAFTVDFPREPQRADAVSAA